MIAAILSGTYVTSLISGVFGMAGGVLLMGLYSFLLPVTIAMILHGLAQSFSNGFRSWFFRDHIVWSLFPGYLLGAAVALSICFWISYVPTKEFVFFLLGVVAVVSVCLPLPKALDIEKPRTPFFCGLTVTFMQIFSGVSGPLLDIFYFNGKLNRHQVIANKAVTQTVGHLLKLFYYGHLMWMSIEHDFTLPYWIIPGIIAVAFLGARSGRFLVKYINELQFQKITKYLILLFGLFYLFKGFDEIGEVEQVYTYMKEQTLFALR